MLREARQAAQEVIAEAKSTTQKEQAKKLQQTKEVGAYHRVLVHRASCSGLSVAMHCCSADGDCRGHRHHIEGTGSEATGDQGVGCIPVPQSYTRPWGVGALLYYALTMNGLENIILDNTTPGSACMPACSTNSAVQ